MKKEKKGLFKKIKTFFNNINNKYFFGRYKGTYKYINKESNIKEYIIKFYGKYEVFITPVLKLLLAMVSLLMINSKLGYMERIDNFAVVVIVALMCSFLPMIFIAFETSPSLF